MSEMLESPFWCVFLSFFRTIKNTLHFKINKVFAKMVRISFEMVLNFKIRIFSLTHTRSHENSDRNRHIQKWHFVAKTLVLRFWIMYFMWSHQVVTLLRRHAFILLRYLYTICNANMMACYNSFGVGVPVFGWQWWQLRDNSIGNSRIEKEKKMLI